MTESKKASPNLATQILELRREQERVARALAKAEKQQAEIKLAEERKRRAKEEAHALKVGRERLIKKYGIDKAGLEILEKEFADIATRYGLVDARNDEQSTPSDAEPQDGELARVGVDSVTA
ncbi:hypothetical protein [Paraburkholderia sp. C35]|uniref:hypothetical protein n=1 Tax=Paraburkholderia sp. C35 TaxID=2126993 RepID=UPI000D68DD85|nr:hypothetical protein [Paraburkholderia sp. C35]